MFINIISVLMFICIFKVSLIHVGWIQLELVTNMSSLVYSFDQFVLFFSKWERIAKLASQNINKQAFIFFHAVTHTKKNTYFS